MKKLPDGITVADKVPLPTMYDRIEFQNLLERIAKRLQSEKQNDENKQSA